jgi:hypothetical protein
MDCHRKRGSRGDMGQLCPVLYCMLVLLVILCKSIARWDNYLVFIWYVWIRIWVLMCINMYLRHVRNISCLTHVGHSNPRHVKVPPNVEDGWIRNLVLSAKINKGHECIEANCCPQEQFKWRKLSIILPWQTKGVKIHWRMPRGCQPCT